MAKAKSNRGPTLIPIRSFRDGVGRQAPSKRLPTEAEDLENVLVTLENSAEKRPGTEFLQCTDGGNPTFNGDLELPGSDDLFHYWFELTPSETYLITVDYTGAGDLLYVSKLLPETGALSKVATVAGDADTKAYVRYGNGTYTAEEALRIIALGPQLLVLNTKVKAGVSSNETGDLFDYDGTLTGVQDDIGGPVSYETSTTVDPENKAIIWVKNRAYSGGTEVFVPGGTGVYRADSNITAANNIFPPTDSTPWELVRSLARIPVKENRYPDASKAYLGQAVNDITDIKLPPTTSDLLAANNAEVMLELLYPDELADGQNGRGTGDGGKGKIYYIENGYGGSEPGYYIVRSATQKPYLMPIRTPEGGSLLAANRLPVRIVPSNAGATWVIEESPWTDRRSGDAETNPGPQAWKDYRQVELSSMALFRNRLWLSAGDTVFSSATNEFGYFYLADPSLVVDTDPIDVLLSSNKYTPVTTLTPFESYMFINTSAGTQFSLQGSENQITPYTAEVSSASFYSTAPLTEPVLMGSQIYFFDDQRMYIFFNDRQVSIQKAIEVSQHCPNFLPESYGAISTMPSYDTVFMVDKNDKKQLYLYTNRYRGDRVVQNAFFRYSFTHDIISIYPYQDSVHFLVKDTNGKYSIQRMLFQESDPDSIYLDDVNKLSAEVGVNAIYNVGDNTTTLLFPGTVDSSADVLMVDVQDKAQPDWGTILTVESIDAVTTPGTIIVVAAGNHAIEGKEFLLGNNFTMTITLSPVYQRDQENNVIDGVLSLRTMHTRHFNTGEYRIETTIRGRDRTPSVYTPMEMDLLDGLDPLALESRVIKGELTTKILGFSDETEIRIVSDTPTPVNITQIELKGVFKNTASSFVQ